MGVFGEFVYGGPSVGGDVYGPEESLAADMLGEDVVVLSLNNTVVVNESFLDTTNYTVTVLEGSGPVSIRSVVAPVGRLTTTTQIILEVDRPTKGTRYRVAVSSLETVNGLDVEGAAIFVGRRTKLESMLRSMARHWDKRPRSIVRNFLSAISIEDDRIGGSKIG